MDEEEEFEFRLRMEQEQAAAPEPEAAPEMEGASYLKGAVNQLNKGTTLGFGDEIAAGGRALIDSSLDSAETRSERNRRATERSLAGLPMEAPDQSFSDTYEMYRGDERAIDQQFQEENPIASLALNATGGLVSPINLLAPGMGSTGGGLSRALQATARGAAEGGITGLGEGQGTLEEQLASMETGGKWGAGIGGSISGVGGLLGRAISNRRVDQELLGKDGVFTPIHLAAKEGFLGDFYRNTVGRAWGGKAALKAQEAPHVQRAEELVNRSKDESAAAIREVEGQAQDVKRGLVQAREQVGDTARADTRAARSRNEVIDADTVEALGDDATNFRAVAAQESLPDDFRATVLEGVDLEDPIAVSRKLKKFWKDDAFRMVKDRNFEWDTSLPRQLKAEFANDPELILAMNNEPELINTLAKKFGLDNVEADKVMQKMQEWAGDTGVSRGDEALFNPKISLDGEALMELRNFFAKRANKGGDKASGYMAIKRKFDDMITSQLDDAATAGYADQLDRWTTNLNYRNAARRAKKTGGKFTPEGYLSAGGKYEDFSLGNQPLQAQASGVIDRVDDVGLARARAKVQRRSEVEQIQDAKRAENTALKQQAQTDLDAIDVKGVRQEAADSVRMAQGARKDLRGLQTPQNPSGLSSLLSTAALGAPVSFGVGAVPAGYAVASGLARPGTQRAIAGQLQIQKDLARALREGNMSKYTQLLSRLSAGQAAQGE